MVSHAVDHRHQKIINYAVTKAFGINKPDSVEVLKGGRSQAKLYKLLINNKYYVVRFINGGLKEREKEIKCMTIAAKAGIAPYVYYANTSDGVIVMDFIKNKQLTKTELSNPKIIIKLATLLRAIHDAPSFGKAKSSNISDVLRQSEGKWEWRQEASLIREGKKKLNSIKAIESLISKNEIKRSCHNDLNSKNVLYDGKRFWVIDWEYASYGDPFLDVATASNFWIFNHSLEELYLHTYFNKAPSAEELAHYFVMKQVSRYVYGIVLMKRAKNLGAKPLSQNEVDKIDLQCVYEQIRAGQLKLNNPNHLEIFGAALLKEGLINMETDVFKRSLSALQNSKNPP